MIKEQLSSYNKALDILGRRDHTEYEMRNKLKQKKYTAFQINDTINKLLVNKLLDDSAFARRYILSAIRYKAVGLRFLRQKLKQKGIGDNIVSEAIADSLDENKQLELIKQAITEWRKLHPRHAADRTRLIRFLLSRGFQMQNISREINNSPNK